MSRPLFAYGTLRDPDVLRLVLRHALPPDAATPATAPGHRVVVFPERTYPAIRIEPGASAEGTLLTGLAGTDVALLDLFEGEEYSRGPIELIVSGASLTADVYWPVQPIGPGAPDWRLTEWTGRHKAAFLAAETQSLAELRRHLTALPR